MPKGKDGRATGRADGARSRPEAAGAAAPSRPGHLRLRQMEVFRAVMLTGTVSEASRLLNVSQPAVTKVLHHAEDQLGLKLFQRIRGRLHSTPEARVLHGEIEKIFAGIENLRSLAGNLRAGHGGRIRVASAPALATDVLPLAIGRFRAKYPDVNFRVETHHYGDLLDAVLVQDTDLGFTFNARPAPGLDLVKLAAGELVAIFPAAQAPALPSTATLGTFAGSSYVGLYTDDPIGAVIRAAALEAGIDLQPSIEVKTNRIAMSLVAHGGGGAIVDPYTAASANPAQVAVRPLTPALSYDMNLVVNARRPLSGIEERFVEEVRAAERSVAEACLSRRPQPEAV
ncbi:LysR substrate-binding domain-containing protein [Arenibaculum pallidiluteum]|uniref:LysR substrate-binding domain-containing protein n=1 Tax=Arenibaculum pallidiluteum TaxID=2812559 RepID=UPI001A971753|nr:LysR substrate-binding domain-containing protein [Arenibaculum pallidiluteum]